VIIEVHREEDCLVTRTRTVDEMPPFTTPLFSAPDVLSESVALRIANFLAYGCGSVLLALTFSMSALLFVVHRRGHGTSMS
jgi:hypothetical protein